MTCNESTDTMHQLLQRENNKDVNICIDYQLRESVEFLDVLIENDHGQLKTSVFRKPAVEPYILPYISDHPHHTHSNTIDTALLRAIRLCSNVDTFHDEQLNVEIALLLNGYPPKFINHHLKQFFHNHNAVSIYTKFDNESYQKLHEKLLSQSIQNNNKFLSSDKEYAYEQRQQAQERSTTIEKNESTTKKSIKQKELIIHYRFEKGPLSRFNREFRKLWEKHFCYQNSPLNNIRLILGTRSNPSLERLLVKKKPSRTLLTRMDTTNETTLETATKSMETGE